MGTGTPTQLYAFNNLAGCVLQRKQEVTGGLVSLYDAQQAGIDVGSHRWATICERHGTIATHRTKKMASDALVLIEWCEACQHTDVMKLARAISWLRCATYQAQFLVGKDRPHALRLAKNWSSIGRAGIFFSTGDQADCFDAAGNLIKPIEWFWEGDRDLVTKMLEDAGLHATINPREEQSRNFSTLVIIPNGSAQSEKEE